MEKVRLPFENDVSDLKEYKKQLYAKIVKSSYYNEFLKQGFSDEDIKDNLVKFDEYIEDAEFCKKIKTYEDCSVFHKFDRLILVKNGDFVEKQYVALAPYVEYLEYNNCFVQRDFPDEYIDAKYLKVDKKLRGKIKEYFSANKWIYLYGSINSGRTYAAVSIINKKFVPEKQSIAFLDSPLALKEICDFYFKNRNEFEELMNTYSNVDCLVLDNFGSEMKSKVLRDNILSVIFAKRIANRKMTIFTSDFAPDVLFQLYSKLKDDNNDIMSNRFIEMLKKQIINGLETSPLPIY